jgi:hypothetical protein
VSVLEVCTLLIVLTDRSWFFLNMNPNIENNIIITVITIPTPIAEQQIMISVLLRELAENNTNRCACMCKWEVHLLKIVHIYNVICYVPLKCVPCI